MNDDFAFAGQRQGLMLMAFRVGAQEFCVDIMTVRELRGWTPATAIPHAPAYVSGVINLRGAVLPIVDLARRLGLPGSEPSARHVVIVVQIGSQTIGLLVDAVSDILTVDDTLVQSTPGVAVAEQIRMFVDGLLPVDGRMISLLNLDRVLPSHVAEAA